ncbi:hypothetical protein FRC10_002696 [Ceratobasidium sp. 414]|nr:hypothetical protein FRC10_002696 [Ceratobasidium sp. 414]
MTTPALFKDWYDSRKHLDEAIQRYFEHSQALEAAVIHHEDNAFGPGALDELFVEVRKERAYVNQRSEKLGRASAALNRVYNQSTADLVHLELSSIPSQTCPGMFMLIRLLSANPGLRVLKLEKLKIAYDGGILPNEIELNVLERLDLVELSPDPCSTLLPKLNPGPGELSLRLEAPIDPTNAEAVLAFLNRSYVTKLYIKAYPDWSSAVDCFAAILDLRMLAIDFKECSDCDSFLKALLPLPDPSTSSVRRWPNLRTLWLVEAELELEDIKNIVEAYHIRTVILPIGRCPDEWAGEALEPLVWNAIVENVLPNTVVADWDTSTTRA